MNKKWVHIRFLLKFIPLQLFGIIINAYGLIIVILYDFIFGFDNFSFTLMLISLSFLPIAIILKTWGKYNPLRFMLDSGRLSDIRPSGLAEDYKNWLDGRSINFYTDWSWHMRNRIQNLVKWLTKKGGKEYLVELITNELIFRDHPIQLTNDEGFMKHDYFAGLKWITKEGKESFQTHSGVKISQDYSIFGTMALYYRIGMAIYYKYSKCALVESKFWKLIYRIFILLFTFRNTFNKDLWRTVKYHSNDELGTIHFKIQWEK